jgi:uncharacterized spore protein YtfJ
MGKEKRAVEVGFAAGLESKEAPSFEPIEKMLDGLSVDAVFGEPTREGDVTVIPVADIAVGFGFGYGVGRGPGRGRGRQQVESEEAPDEEEGSEAAGVGGGAGGRARPRGYIHITPDGVAFKSIVDETRISLAGIAFSAWSVFWIAKTIRTFARASEE